MDKIYIYYTKEIQKRAKDLIKSLIFYIPEEDTDDNVYYNHIYFSLILKKINSIKEIN